MPLAGVESAAKEYHEKKAAAESGGVLYFKLADGEEATVRFLEEGTDFTSFYVHKLPQEGKFFPEVPCLNQKKDGTPCPGCEKGIKRSYKFAINLIWRNGPVYERDKDNKLVKEDGKLKETGERKDGVFVWTGGIQVAEDLDHLDGKYKGLMSRDFDIKRSGVKLDTTYRIDPNDATPLTDADKALISSKYDLNDQKKPPEYDDFFNYRKGGGSKNSSGGSSDSSNGERRSSPFRRRERSDD